MDITPHIVLYVSYLPLLLNSEVNPFTPLMTAERQQKDSVPAFGTPTRPTSATSLSSSFNHLFSPPWGGFALDFSPVADEILGRRERESVCVRERVKDRVR
jgi:hypothetical protein